MSSAHRLLAYLDACTAWALSPYVGCEFRCVYCNARAQGASHPYLPPDQLVQAFRREIAGVPPDYSIILGVLGDAYPPVEAELGATRLLIRELIRERRKFHIVTKGETVCRDIDLLAPYAVHCCVHVSLCTLNDAALASLDPGAPPAAARLAVVERLHATGVQVEVKAAPWIPRVTDAPAILSRAPSGVVVEFAPLNLSRYRGHLKLLGLRYDQEMVDRLYFEAREQWKSLPNSRWLDPSSGAHHPFAAAS